MRLLRTILLAFVVTTASMAAATAAPVLVTFRGVGDVNSYAGPFLPIAEDVPFTIEFLTDPTSVNSIDLGSVRLIGLATDITVRAGGTTGMASRFFGDTVTGPGLIDVLLRRINSTGAIELNLGPEFTLRAGSSAALASWDLMSALPLTPLDGVSIAFPTGLGARVIDRVIFRADSLSIEAAVVPLPAGILLMAPALLGLVGVARARLRR